MSRGRKSFVKRGLGRIGGVVCAAAIFGLLAPALPVFAGASTGAAKVTKCGGSISSCGCTITKPGFYEVTTDLSYDQGLNADGSCLAVKASKVVLTTGQCTNGTNCAHYDITGPGGATPTGIGLHIMKSSSKDFIELPSAINGWDVGVLVEGNNNIVENFGTHENGTAGVELNKANGNNINDFGSDTNVNYGVWLKQSKNNQINCNNASLNGNIGIYVGCSANGPVSSKCKGVGSSNGNRIYDSSWGSNANYGVVIDLGNNGNTVTDTGEDNNAIYDLFDANSGCGTNQWFFNNFTTSNQSCIQ